MGKENRNTHPVNPPAEMTSGLENFASNSTDSDLILPGNPLTNHTQESTEIPSSSHAITPEMSRMAYLSRGRCSVVVVDVTQAVLVLGQKATVDDDDEIEYSPKLPCLEWDPEGPLVIEHDKLSGNPTFYNTFQPPSDMFSSPLHHSSSFFTSPGPDSRPISPQFDSPPARKPSKPLITADQTNSSQEPLEDWQYFEENNPDDKSEDMPNLMQEMDSNNNNNKE